MNSFPVNKEEGKQAAHSSRKKELGRRAESRRRRRRKTGLRVRDILLIILPILIILTLFLPPLTARIRKSRRSAQTEEEQIPDVTPPFIYLTRDRRYFVPPGGIYEEEGYAAYDDRDGDITDKVDVSVGKDTVRYRVTDNAGNITIRFRRIPRADSESGELSG